MNVCVILGIQGPEAKCEALSQKAVRFEELKAWGAAPTFEQMNEYTRVNLRVRFLKGFCPSALADLNEKIFSKMGAQNMAHKKFPLTNQLLMSPDILTSGAFTRSKDVDQVPAWRDGAAGRALQALRRNN